MNVAAATAKARASALDRLKYYGKQTNVHGLKYVADESRNLVIRLTWLAIFFLCFYGMMLVFQSLYETYTEKSISFVTDTAHLKWNTSFPAVTVCEITSSEITWEEDAEDAETVTLFINDLLFFTGSCYTCNTPCETCKTLNFTDVVQKFRKPCEELLTDCTLNEVEFDCCEQFFPIETEYGLCYSFNSLNSRKPEEVEWNEVYANERTGPVSLLIRTYEDIRFYFHAREDVPFINSNPDHRKDVMLGETHDISINVIEIDNDDKVKGLSVEKRACRFPDEKPENLIVHDHYSYSSCVVQCHADAHIELCNCTHHLMPVLNRAKYCDIEGLKCLTDHFETVNRLHAKGFDKPGLVCDCLPSCVEPEYKVVADTKGVEAVHSEITIRMQSLPTFRFKRVVVRTTMDLVVSIGGAAGLFIGASILSIVEAFYLLCLRRKCSSDSSEMNDMRTRQRQHHHRRGRWAMTNRANRERRQCLSKIFYQK